MSKQNISDSTTSANKSGDLLKLIFYWALAMIPLAWGVTETVLKSLALFR